MTNIPTFLVCLVSTASVCAAEIIVSVNATDARGLDASAGLMRLVDQRDGQPTYPAFSALGHTLPRLNAHGAPRPVKKPTLS